jgi:hypothetical protein
MNDRKKISLKYESNNKKIIDMKKIISTVFCLLLFNVIFAQEKQDDLAKKLANPVASLISVPFQNNIDYGIGDYKGSRYTLNFQPVIPMSISKDFNLISRIIVPIVSQYNITGYGNHESGLSDIVATAFISPKDNKGGLIWGAGPVILVPTGTNVFLTSKKFGIGPSIVLLKQNGGWTYGTLLNQIWSVAGEKNRSDVSQFYANPFATYNWKSGAGITAQLEWTENWVQKNTTLFFEPMFSGLTTFGKQKVSFAVGPRINVAAPDATRSKFGLRAAIVLLFPK